MKCAVAYDELYMNIWMNTWFLFIRTDQLIVWELKFNCLVSLRNCPTALAHMFVYLSHNDRAAEFLLPKKTEKKNMPPLLLIK